MLQAFDKWGNKIYDQLPSYEKMLYSFKPLKVHYWFNIFEVDQLLALYCSEHAKKIQ